MIAHINGYDERLEKKEEELAQKSKGQLIALGKRYGFEFDELDEKSDIVVEIAAAILEEEGENEF